MSTSNSSFRIALCLFIVLAISACKKSNPATVVGNWQVSAFTASDRSFSRSLNDTSTQSTTYDAQSKTLMIITQHSSGIPDDTAIHTVAYSNWNILANGTYNISEKYDTIVTNASNNWEYLSNSNSNNAVSFAGGGSRFFSPIGSDNLSIQTVSANKLVLTNNTYSSDSGVSFSSHTGTITFVK